MSCKFFLGAVLAGCLVLGAANSAVGQVWLEAPLLETSFEKDADDRFGDYEPLDLFAARPTASVEGPQLISQTDEWVQPPGQRVSQPAPAPISPRPDAEFGPVPPASPSLAPPLLPVTPPFTEPPMISPPVVVSSGYGMPLAPVQQRSCSPWRPCGPQDSFGMNWLFPQGFAGADYRPACAQHDACLASGCYSRKACDRMLLSNMDCACHNSRFPILCRLEARKCYLGVRMFGWLWY